MARQVIAATKVLPPFEVVDFQKELLVAVRTPQGDIISIRVPVSLFENEDKFIEATRQDIKDIIDSGVMVKATKLELVQQEKI